MIFRKMKISSKQFETIFIFFYYTGKILGTCPFNLGKNFTVKISIFGTFYNVLLSVMYMTLGIIMIHIRFGMIVLKKKTRLAKIMDALATICHAFSLSSIWLQLAFKQKEIQEIVQHFKMRSEFSKKENKAFLKALFLQLFLFNVYFMNLDIVCNIRYYNVMPPHVIGILSTFDFFHHVERSWIIFFFNIFCLIKTKFVSICKQVARWKIDGNSRYGMKFEKKIIKLLYDMKS